MSPYIPRSTDQRLLSKLKQAIKFPQESPVAFHIWGMGGVGKSTLLREIEKEIRDSQLNDFRAHQLDCWAKVSFGETDAIDTPLGLIKTLYKALVNIDSKAERLFSETLKLYEETLYKLETQPVSGSDKVDWEQVKKIKQRAQSWTEGLVKLVRTEPEAKLAGAAAGAVVDVSGAVVTVKDEVEQLLRQHQVTRKKQALQDLMSNPLSKLTELFVNALEQKASICPIFLVFDTYEKAPIIIDEWLRKTLSDNQKVLQSNRIRIVIAGRNRLLDDKNWAKLKQDDDRVYEECLDRFNQNQTTSYLAEVGLADQSQARLIFQRTKGLPYYLNWVREQYSKGKEIDFSQGKQEIERLLLQGLGLAQQPIVQIAACCRSFDQGLLRHLLTVHDIDFEKAIEGDANCYKWLTQQSTFVQFRQGRHRLDDVARDVFRQTLFLDEELFRSVHSCLADYFKQKSDREVPEAGLYSEKYNNTDWCKYRSEYLYHLLFSRRPEAQIIFKTHLLEAEFFNHDDQDKIAQVTLKAIQAEAPLKDYRFLSSTIREFLVQLQPVIRARWVILGIEEIPYDKLQELDFSKQHVDRSWQVCLEQLDRLNGLAKFMALLFKAKRSKTEKQKLSLLSAAEEQAEKIITETDLVFNAQLFYQHLGPALEDLEHYEAAIRLYNQALEYRPEDYQPERYSILVNRGYAYEGWGKYEAALKSHSEAIALDPEQFLGWFNQGIQLKNLKRYDEAMTSLDKALEIKSEDAFGWYAHGIISAKLKRYEDAVISYSKAVELKPGMADAWYNRGVGLSKLRQPEEALESYDKALEVNTNMHEAWFNRGYALDELGRYEESLASYNEALKIKPDKSEALSNKGLALARLNRHKEAIACFDEALALAPNSIQTWSNKASSLGKLGHYKDAIASYDTVLALNPNAHRIWLRKGLTQTSWEYYDDALISLDKSLAIQPEATTWLARSIVLSKLNRLEEGLKNCDQALQLNGEDALALQERGQILSKLHRYEEALESYDKALKLKPDTYKFWYFRGLILVLLDSKEEALTSYDKALKLQPESPEAWHSRGNALRDLGRYDDAIASFDQAIALKPDYAPAWDRRGVALVEMAQFEDAMFSFDQALALNPDDGEIWYNKGCMLNDMERYEDAVTSYDKAVALNPAYHEAWYNRGNALYHLGRFEDAISSYDKVVDIKPKREDAWLNRSIALQNLERYEDAMSSYEAVLKLNPKDDKALYNQARVYAFWGNQEQALDKLEQAIELNPETWKEESRTEAEFDAIRDTTRFKLILLSE